VVVRGRGEIAHCAVLAHHVRFVRTVYKDVLTARADCPCSTLKLSPRGCKSTKGASCARSVQWASSVISPGTVLRAYHAFVGVWADGADCVVVAIVGALGGGVRAGFGACVRY
jgi:hypothetical protein